MAEHGAFTKQAQRLSLGLDACMNDEGAEALQILSHMSDLYI